MMNEKNIELQATIMLTAERLVATYEVRNMSDEDILVLDGLFRTEGVPVLDNSMAYTVLEGANLTLFRGVVPVPEGMQVESPEVPFARLLPAGESLKGTIEAPLPLALNDPYAMSVKEEIRSVKQARLRVGYLAAKDLDSKPGPRIIGTAKVDRVGYRQAVGIQHFAEIPFQDCVVTVHVMS